MGWGTVSMAGKVALVSGAGIGGVGYKMAESLASVGAKLFVIDRTEQLVADTLTALHANGAEAEGMTADLRNAAQARRVVPEALARFGRVDHVANIAGGTQLGEWARLEETSDDIYRSVMALNLDYVFQICRAAAQDMIARGEGGSIVNISSVSALNAAPYHGVYGAAKAALIAMTKTMAVEWGQHHIRANLVTPGAVATARAGNRVARFKDKAPLGRAASPQDIADAAMFLLSDLSSAITGQNLVVDTGLTAKSVLGEASDMIKTLDMQAEALKAAS